MWICPACDTENPDYASFCAGCGKRKETGWGESAWEESGDAGRPPRRQGSLWWLWGLLGLLVLVCAALAVILLWQRNRPVPGSGSGSDAGSGGYALVTPIPLPSPGADAGATATPGAAGPGMPTPEPSGFIILTPTPGPTATIPQTPAPTAVIPQTPTPATGYSGYLTDLSQLGSQGLGQLCQVMEETIDRNVRTSWGSPEHLDRSVYVGCYLLSAAQEDTRPRSILILIYQNDVTISIPAQQIYKSLSYYYMLRFENVWCSADGSLTLSTPQGPAGTVYANIPGHNFYYSGYETLDALRNSQITPLLGKYTLSETWA